MQVYIIVTSLTSTCTFPLFFPILVVTWLQHIKRVCVAYCVLATIAITTLPMDKHSHGQGDAMHFYYVIFGKSGTSIGNIFSGRSA